MFLENETWELCPVKSNFSIAQLHVSPNATDKTLKCSDVTFIHDRSGPTMRWQSFEISHLHMKMSRRVFVLCVLRNDSASDGYKPKAYEHTFLHNENCLESNSHGKRVKKCSLRDPLQEMRYVYSGWFYQIDGVFLDHLPSYFPDLAY